LKISIDTILAVVLVATPMASIGADEYRVLTETQTKNLFLASQIGAKDGHNKFTIPAIIYQESKAGADKNHPTFIGAGQVTAGAIKEVIKEEPASLVYCNKSTDVSKLKKLAQSNDACGIAIASGYLKVIRTKYKFHSTEQQLVAYQMGPIAAKRVASSKYSKSVLAHKRKLQQIME
jgi:hypothetical protein